MKLRNGMILAAVSFQNVGLPEDAEGLSSFFDISSLLAGLFIYGIRKKPTGNLDSENSRDIIDLLKLSNKRYRQTLIVITHDEDIALQADRIISIEDGKMARDEVIRP